MRPLVIADSDDESDSNEHLAAAPAVPLPLPQTRSPEQGSLATASTDSVFFQQVYNEQNGAALEKAQQLQQDLGDAPHESSAMTIPDVPFQRTTKGFYHSSTTTATDPLMDKPPDTEAADPCAGWPQITPREELHHETQTGAVDPWEVPSSPEVPAALERQLKRHSYKTADQVYKRDGLSSTKDALLDGYQDIEEMAQSRSKKRRRLDKSGGTPSTTDEVSLIMLPSSSRSMRQDGEGAAAASSIPLPSMPLDAGSTSSPRRPFLTEREQSFHLDVDSAPTGPSKHNNLLLKQQTQYDIGSSGTATNINTQRTQLVSKQNLSSLAPEELDVEVGTRKAEYRSYGIRRDSSPDIISTLAPVHKKAAQSEPEHSPGLTPKANPDQEYRDGRNSSAHQPPPQELQSGGNEAEFVAHPTPIVKPKKKRGRPKKPPETDEPLPMKPAAGPLSAAADGTPAAAAQKKRRGRPKKQSTEVAIDGASPPAATAVPALVVGSDTKASSGLEKASVSAEGDDMIQAATAQSTPRNSSKKGAARDVSSAAETTECGQDQAAPGSRGGTKDQSASQSSPDKPEEEDVPKEPRQPAARAREEKSECDKKGSSAQGIAKPLYRVGLSKRFKIAPLLKSVRKP